MPLFFPSDKPFVLIIYGFLLEIVFALVDSHDKKYKNELIAVQYSSPFTCNASTNTDLRKLHHSNLGHCITN